MDGASFGDEAVSHLGALGDVMRRQTRGLGIDAPALVMHVDGRHGLHQEAHVGFPQALDGSDVLPVSLKVVREHALLIPQHGGDDILSEVVGALLVRFVIDEVFAQLLPGEDVDAHGGLVALRLLWLLFEFDDPVVRVCVHDAEAGRFLPRNGTNRDGRVRAVADVIIQHGVVIHLVDMVAAEDQDIVRIILLDEGHVLIDGVGRSAVPLAAADGLIGRQDENAAVGDVQIPGSAAADVGVQLQGLILRQHADGVNAAVGAVAQREVDDPVLSSVGHGGLRHVLRQDTKPASLSAGQKHGNASLFS